MRNRLFQENHARDGREIEELRRICCEEIEQTRKTRSEELSVQQRRNPTTESQMMAQIQDLQYKVNSLSDARELYDPESGSSSGATDVPDQTSTILSSRTLPRCDSGLPRNTQNCTGIMGNVFERPPAQEGQSSTIFNNSKNLASSSRNVRLNVAETARRDMKKSLNTPIQPSHFQSRSGILDRTSETHSHVGMMDYLRVPTTEWNLGKFPDSMEFQSWKLKFRTEVCMRTAEPQVTMLCSQDQQEGSGHPRGPRPEPSSAFPTGDEACPPSYKSSLKGRRARQRVDTGQGSHQRLDFPWDWLFAGAHAAAALRRELVGLDRCT